MIAQVQEENGNKVAIPISGSIPTGLPVGTWISFEKDQAPDNKWIKAGVTFDENLYPALYLFLGTNKVPERFDHSRLGDIETITLSTTNTEMQYDGELMVSFLKSANLQGYSVLVNDVSFTLIDSGNAQVGTTITIPFKKGDKIRLNVSYSPNNTSVRYYKHPMFIKATSAIEITDQSTFLNTVQSLVQTSNSYSTEETATGGFWIDGKPIYRKIFSGTLSSGTSWTIQSSLKSTIGADYITEMRAIANANNGTVSNNYYSSNTDYLRVLVDGSGNLVLARGSSYPALPFTYSIIVEYTKN